MRVALAVVCLLVSAVAGAALSWATRPRPARPGARPAVVERVVRALDRLDASSVPTLKSALEAAGPAASQPSPWREELELAAILLAGDRAALRAFAARSPDVPARARALLRIAQDEPVGPARSAALAALVARFPDSAAARVYGAPTSGAAR